MTTRSKKFSAIWMATGALLLATAWSMSMTSCGAGDAPYQVFELKRRSSLTESAYIERYIAQHDSAPSA